MYQEEDRAERERAKYEMPLLDWSEDYATKTVEQQFIDAQCDEKRKLDFAAKSKPEQQIIFDKIKV
jgi:hypothetical protein